MSKKSVFDRCVKNVPSIDQNKLNKDLEKVSDRFIKTVKASYNESQNMSFWESMAGDPKEAVNAKNTSFEANKEWYIHNHLRVLIDLFDYEK